MQALTGRRISRKGGKPENLTADVGFFRVVVRSEAPNNQQIEIRRPVVVRAQSGTSLGAHRYALLGCLLFWAYNIDNFSSLRVRYGRIRLAVSHAMPNATNPVASA